MVVAAFGSAASPSHPVLTARCLWSRSYLDTMARTGTGVEGEAEMLAAACVFNLKIQLHGFDEDHSNSIVTNAPNMETATVHIAHYGRDEVGVFQGLHFRSVERA